MHRRTFAILLAGLAAGSLVSAQVQKPKEAPAVRDAGAVGTLEPRAPLQLAVLGMTKENVSLAKTSLTELMVETHVCSGCRFEQVKPGRCTKCNQDLKLTKVPLLVGVAPAEDFTSLTLTLDSRRPTRLSQIESALARNSVRVQNPMLHIPSTAFLVLSGGTAEAVTAVEKALVASNLFAEVHAAWEPSTSQIFVLVRAGATPALRADVLKVLGAHGLQLVDVIFGARP